MAYDSSPDSVMAALFRRDGNQPSDWFYVSFDSYNDNRTAFTFAVNPRGVQKDILYYNDTSEDILWDAVWEAETRLFENGWSAEIRIPLSQLRFSAISEQHLWGINFQRRIARKGEVSFWAPTSQSENRLVSQFGILNGIDNLQEPRRLEIIPYAAVSNLRAPDLSDGNPFYNRNQFSGNIGGDIQYGLSSNFTLTATINADFGQVEADPSVINLTANETFFSERRPFFLEGVDIFRFGTTKTFSSFGNPNTFYSRRIGRTPQGSPALAGENAEFVDQPDQTTLIGTFRFNWTFSTTMSLQTYVRPFIASGKFRNFKELAEPRSFNFTVYGGDSGSIAKTDGLYTVTPAEAGAPEFSFTDPDFNFRSIQGNAVFRWEYRPGSTLFLVWQQQRDDVAGTGDFNFSRDMSELFRSKPINIFLIKASFWLGT